MCIAQLKCPFTIVIKKKNPGQYVILSSSNLHTVILGQTKNDKLDPYVQVFFSLFFYLFIF